MKVVELSGGVGGARMARGLAAVDDVDLTVIVNVGDDAENHGLAVSPDLDTVIYTLAGIEGPRGWGRRDDTFHFNEEIGRFGIDNTFRLGDRDLALKIYRTRELNRSIPLSSITRAVASSFGLATAVVPVTDDPLRTIVHTDAGSLSFQEYFVARRHRDRVRGLDFEGADRASPAPGVMESIDAADLVVVAPSNPPLSIWPLLAVDGVRDAVVSHSHVVAVSPLIGGKTVKGPADKVMADLGLGIGSEAVARAYDGLIDTLFIDVIDEGDAAGIDGVTVVATDTLIEEPEAARRLAAEITGA